VHNGFKGMKSAIIVMAKAPIAGTVKTRLTPFLSFEQASQLAACFLRDTINKAKKLKNQLIIAYSPSGHRRSFDEFLTDKIILIEQKGETLGDKMFSAFQFAFEQKLDSVVMIGTDSPTLPLEFIEKALDFLEKNADAVLGKTTDGGFYLIGLRQLERLIFEKVEWSSAKTFEQTARNIIDLGWQLKKTPDWYDVDEPKDLIKLAEEFKQEKSSRKLAPETFIWLKQNVQENP
jgi:rSAM/selenodomain-associated transferase 1